MPCSLACAALAANATTSFSCILVSALPTDTDLPTDTMCNVAGRHPAACRARCSTCSRPVLAARAREPLEVQG